MKKGQGWVLLNGAVVYATALYRKLVCLLLTDPLPDTTLLVAPQHNRH
jgi:hypothetical protein